MGCGCGAITRYLGENFDDVISIEGSTKRAEIARARTNDLANVTIISAPFHKINFETKFDFIFVIGVFEYSPLFIEHEDPYDFLITYFSNLLKENGTLIIAIENQFGLKYLNGCHEDHLGKRYIGIEGYHRKPDIVKTFGKHELQKKLSTSFTDVQFYYPYPDYKIPDLVISEDFLRQEHAGELISEINSRDYNKNIGSQEALWDEKTTLLELARNNILDFFSNSFLVFASKNKVFNYSFPQEAILFSKRKQPKSRVNTIIYHDENGLLYSQKRIVNKNEINISDKIQIQEATSYWINSKSLLTELYILTQNTKNKPEDIFKICELWIKYLKGLSFEKDNKKYLRGCFLDAIFQNTYIINNNVKLIDEELKWHTDIKIEVIIIRAIYSFLGKTNFRENYYPNSSIYKIIIDIAKLMGFSISRDEINEFILIESELNYYISSTPKTRSVAHMKYFIYNTSIYNKAALLQRKFLDLKRKINTKISIFLIR